MNNLVLNSEYMSDYHQHYHKMTTDQPIMYHPGSPSFYMHPMTTTTATSSPQSIATAHTGAAGPMYYDQAVMGSPDSFMSGMSPSTPPSSMQPSSSALSHKPAEPPMLVASSSSSTTASSSSSSAYLNQTIAKAASLPESFYPEFLQYSKESFEQPQCSVQNRKKRRCMEEGDGSESPRSDEDSQQQLEHAVDQHEQHQQAVIDDEAAAQGNMSTAEMRRQIHIQSEQKRRAQIKDGFEDLRNELPACLNKKMSKVALLHRTVQHIQHLKSTQMTILAELERLVHENEQLRKFQESVLQKQALENMNMYSSMGNM
ncbi:hypothetical protein BDB00DRAFT_783541 [Zychaea mexicana]|uniref:uncharacterized protein n=1 Tax=Zychaea mexicana TaxID=64656 RepID=UPI0022FEF0F5|nr:uncharacterized protein BDB00DRAFT_783541 [Zychaea mexicana]KAI9498928.1 hypothetical protein BDB00DRAFT_783541 [Zychaea mexicana]